MASYRDLLVWQKAMDLTETVYAATRQLPAEERYGLSSQMRRAAMSVPLNISEGQGRLTPGEFRQSLGHARGSLMELETALLLCERLHFLEATTVKALLSRTTTVAQLLHKLLSSDLSQHGCNTPKPRERTASS